MEPAEIVAALALANGLVINGQKLAITLNGKELTNDEIVEKIDLAILEVQMLRDND